MLRGRIVMFSALAVFSVCTKSLPGQGLWTIDPLLEMPAPRNLIQAAKDRSGRMYLPGGNEKGTEFSVDSVFRLDESTGVWETVAILNVPRTNAAVASDASGRIYAIGGGGRDGLPLASVERYDPDQDLLELVSPLPEPIGGAKAVTDRTGENIYVVGGSSGAGPRRTVYRYHVPTDTWTEKAPMIFPRLQHGAALGRDGKIYAVGGFGTTSGGPDSTGGTAECYDPATGAWTQVASMSSHPHQVGAVTSDACGFIYAIGGWNPGYTNAVERYDPATDSWAPFPGLNVARNNMAAIVGDSGRLYVFGGDAGFSAQRSVERTDACILDANQPPDCSAARPSVDSCWPPNHRFKVLEILGPIDPDGDEVTITVTRILQDEAVDAPGSGATCPDGVFLDLDGDGNPEAAGVRCERSGEGNGRVYTVEFVARDGRGGECGGSVVFCVPHDGSPGASCTDNGVRFDSMACASEEGAADLIPADSAVLTRTEFELLTPEPLFLRGDTDWSGELLLTDSILTLQSLFVSGERMDCEDAADANDDGTVDLSDAVMLLSFLFSGGDAPRPPYGVIGRDPTPDALGCD